MKNNFQSINSKLFSKRVQPKGLIPSINPIMNDTHSRTTILRIYDSDPTMKYREDTEFVKVIADPEGGSCY